jgi:hypothetical protein
MTHNNHARHTALPGVCLLIWCCCTFLPGVLSAQCNVYFSFCPGDITVTDCDNSGYEAINWPEPIAATTGGCMNFNIQQTSGPAPGTLVASPGTYTITYAASAVDIATGKKSKAGCTITVHLESDNTPPVFTYCPPDITLYTGNELTATGQWSTPVATDNCSENVTVKTKTPCNTAFKPGIHYVEYKAVDAAGNAVWCIFTVTVIPGFPKPAANRNEADGSTTVHGTEVYPFDITLTPNPFRDQMALHTSQVPEKDLDVRVFDMQGRQVGQKQWPAGAFSIRLSTEDMGPGVFYIKISTAEGAFISTIRGVKL